MGGVIFSHWIAAAPLDPAMVAAAVVIPENTTEGMPRPDFRQQAFAGVDFRLESAIESPPAPVLALRA